MTNDDTPPHNPFKNPDSIDDMASMYLFAVKSILASLKEQEENFDAHGADIMYVLAQAQARWLTSALRYWTQIANIVGTQGAAAVEVIKPSPDGPSDEARRLILLDKARGTLREISDLSLSEAKLLQRELMEIEAEMRDLLIPDDLDEPGRFHGYKP